MKKNDHKSDMTDLQKCRKKPISSNDRITFYFEDLPIEAHIDDTVAEALMANGEKIFSRSHKYHRPRGPFCFKGNCGQCLLNIDGLPSQLSCKTKVQNGMITKRQHSMFGSNLDVMRIADYLFPSGFNHHTIFATPSTQANKAILGGIRKTIGVGELPKLDDFHETPVPQKLPQKKTDILFVGQNPLFLQWAQKLKEERIRCLIITQERCQSSVADPQIFYEHQIISAYLPNILLARSHDTMIELQAKLIIFAEDHYSQNMIFQNNDLAGIFSADGLLEIYQKQKIVAGENGILAVNNKSSLAMKTADLFIKTLQAELSHLTLICIHDNPKLDIPVSDTLHQIYGVKLIEAKESLQGAVKGLVIKKNDGTFEEISSDFIAICEQPLHAYDIPSLLGSKVIFLPDSESFEIITNEYAQTTQGHIFWFSQTRIQNTSELEKYFEFLLTTFRTMKE